MFPFTTVLCWIFNSALFSALDNIPSNVLIHPLPLLLFVIIRRLSSSFKNVNTEISVETGQILVPSSKRKMYSPMAPALSYQKFKEDLSIFMFLQVTLEYYMMWWQIQHRSDYLPGKLQCAIIFEGFNEILLSLFFKSFWLFLNSMSLRKKCNHTIHLGMPWSKFCYRWVCIKH